MAILPFIEQSNIYNLSKLDEPWDGPNNKRLLQGYEIKTYQLFTTTTTYGPVQEAAPANQTYYRVFVGNGAAFEKTRGLKLGDFPGGTANTILIVEAAQSVPWTKPDDLPYDPNRPLPPLGGHFRNVFLAAAVDGSIHQVPKDTPESTLRLLLTRNGGRFP